MATPDTDRPEHENEPVGFGNREPFADNGDSDGSDDVYDLGAATDEPDQLQLGRKYAGRHLAFSLGEHHCPGASLSRFEQNCAWDILLRRAHDFRPAPDKNTYDHVHGMWVRALKELHIEFTPSQR